MIDSDAWCGAESGYSRIDSKQLELAAKALSPMLSKTLPA